MKAKVIAKTTVNNLPAKVGEIVEVDENTFRNLAKKGRLEAADKIAEAVDLEEPSVLSEEQAEKNVEAQVKAKKEAKAEADAKKKAK